MSKCPFLANKHEIFAGSPDIMSCHKIYHTIIHYWENRCGKINCQQRLVTVHSTSLDHVTRLDVSVRTVYMTAPNGVQGVVYHLLGSCGGQCSQGEGVGGGQIHNDRSRMIILVIFSLCH